MEYRINSVFLCFLVIQINIKESSLVVYFSHAEDALILKLISKYYSVTWITNERLVEVTGLEPATYCLQSSRSPSWATPPKRSRLLNNCQWRLVGLVGLEPTTPALSRRCSNQLSYRPKSVTFNLFLNVLWTIRNMSSATCFQQPISVSVWICCGFPERRWSSRTFRYGYLVTTSPQSRTLPW